VRDAERLDGPDLFEPHLRVPEVVEEALDDRPAAYEAELVRLQHPSGGLLMRANDTTCD
jgi:hypothetical protein